MFVDILYIFVKYVVLIVSLGLLFCRPKMLIYFSFSIVTIVIEELMKYNVVVHGEIKTYMLFGNLYTIPENQILSFIMIIQIIVLIIFRKRILSNKE
jgi:ABC-type Mn2+/Zn2+ transport system permease subunit